MRALRSTLILRLTCSYGLSMLCMAVAFGTVASLLSAQLTSIMHSRLIAAYDYIPQAVASVRGPDEPLVKAAPRIRSLLEQPGIAVAVVDKPSRSIQPAQAYWLPVLFGLHAVARAVPGGEIILFPDARSLGTPYIVYLCELIVLGVLAFLLAGVLGYSVTLGAIRPIRQVTEALGHLADGDFRGHQIKCTGRSEIGELAAAYNRAAARVTLALSDSDRAQAQMRQFIADASHELRTPLTVLLCYIDALRKSYPDDEVLRERIFQTMILEGDRMRSLVNNLIMLMRMEQDHGRPLRSIDLTDLVEKVITSMAALDPRKRLRAGFRAEARIMGDFDELYDAISNIVDNALKYAPEGDIVLTVDHDGTHSWLKVSDHGPGIPAEEQAYVFERFYRGEDRAEVEGSGLGLPIAQRAVQRSGGKIVMTSEMGAGTTFQLIFPLFQEPGEEIPAEETPADEASAAVSASR